MPGKCSKTCGGGVHIDSRGKVIEASFGGAECEGEATRKGACNMDECPNTSGGEKYFI